jgi:hypothetical protein
MSVVTPLNLNRLPFGQRVRLTAEVLSTYIHVRWVMRDDDAERSVSRLRADARRSMQTQRTEGRSLERGDMEGEPERARELELLAGLRLAHATRRVLGILPSDSRCLFRSLTLLCLLERRGIPQMLVLAVRPRPFSAHAWVEVGGEPVLPDADPGYERLLEL